MALDDCIKKMGKALNQKDADAIRAIAERGVGDVAAVEQYLEHMARALPNTPIVSPGVYQPAVDTANAYMESAGLEYTPPQEYAPPVDTARAERIADEFEQMEHAPLDETVKAAYDAMINETIAQFRTVLDTGLEIHFIRGEDPYGNPNQMTMDVRENNHMWVFPTEDGFGSDSTFDVEQNPLLAETEFEIDGHKLLANDVFRIVHDYFGHVAHGAGFRARGEEHAWQSHASMFTPLARRAMTTETRGQNSWVNYGPYGETNRTATGETTQFADQKIGLMPTWVSEDGRLSAHERRQRFEADRQANTTGFEGAIDEEGRVELVHYSREQLARVDPARWGTGLSRSVRSEANRRAAGAPGRVYFGIESANEQPYRKESGLGNRRLVTRVPGELVYDIAGDPDGLRVKGDVVATEQAILDAGYMGYVRNHPELGKVVAVFDELPVEEVTRLAQSARAGRGPRGDGGISTRLPTAVKAKEDPMAKPLRVGLSASKKDRKGFEHNTSVIEGYDNYRPAGNADTPDKVANRFISHVKNNLLWLFDQVDEDMRERSHMWYDGARDITNRWTARFDLPDTGVAGVLAALSPQKDWFMNVSLAERVLETYVNKQNVPWSDEMTKTAARIYKKDAYKPLLKNISGKMLSELESPYEIAAWIRAYDESHNDRGHRIVSPEGNFQDWARTNKGVKKKTGWGSLAEISKAVAVLQDPSIENVSARMGKMHKVRNFYNNIIAPYSEHGDITIDTHAVAAGLVKPLSGKSVEVTHNFGGTGIASSSVYGTSGTYGLYAEAYRIAAKERGVSARQMQSITWEAVRGLFTPGYKSQAKNVEFVESVWQQYRDGKLSLENARNQIHDHAEGINDPDWAGSSGGLDEGATDSSYLGELPGPVVSRPEQPEAGGPDTGAAADDTGGVTTLAQENRATIELRENNQRLITLGATSDRSSFLHESAHLFLELEKQLAKEFGESDHTAPLFEWLGVETWEQIGTEEHEKFAETFEVYLETGKAPSVGLRDAFAAFRRWLTAIYRSMDPRQRADLTPEITEYFDRMLATDAEIEQLAGNPAYDQFFRSKEQSGMTDAEWEKYQAQREKAKDKATNTLDQKLITELTNRATQQWKDEKQPIVEEEKERLRKEPVYQVLTNLAIEPMDYDAVKALNGGKIPGKMIGKAKKGGADPDLYAEAHGFASAKQMINAINETPTLNKAADAAAEAIMVAKHGDILNDGSIEQEARDAMHSDEQAKVLLAELKALDKTSPIDLNYLKSEAKRLIASLKFKDIKPGKYYRAEIRAAKKAATAKTPEEAFEAKSQQAANHYLYKEAVQVRESMQRHRKYIKGAQTRKYNPRQVEPSYIANIKAIANMYDMRKNTERVQDMNAVISWYTTQLQDENQYVDITLLDLNILRGVQAKDLSPDNQIPADFKLPQFDDLNAEHLASVYDQLRHLRFVGGVRSEDGKEEKAAKRTILSESILEKGGDDKKGQRGIPGRNESTKRSISHFFNSMLSLRNISRKMDNEWDGNEGYVYQMVFAPVEAASNKLVSMKHDMYNLRNEKLKDLHKAKLKRTDSESYMLESGMTLDMHSESRFMMALYWGTESGREAIMQGFGVSQRDVTKILAHMTPTQVALVNSVWQVNETLWPELSKTSTTLYGVAPAKLDATPFVINGVPMTGGHMRLFYDSSELELKTEQASNGSQSNVMPNKAGSLHARVGSGGRPPSLDVSNIVVSLDEAMHFIAFAETGNMLHGLIDSNEVKGAIEKKHGPGFYKSFIDNVDNKTGNRSARETVPGLAKLARLGRRTVTMAYLAYSIKNTVESVSALPFAMDEVGPKRFMANAAKIYSSFLSPGNNFTEEMILSRSKYMRDRGQLVSRESNEFVHQMTSTSSLDHAWKKVQSLGFTPQIMVDKMFSYPVWMSAYERAMEDPNMTETKAVSIADTSVAESVGSGSDLHMGGMLASNQTQWVKLFTAFNSWFNMVAQRLYKATKGGTDMLTKDALTGILVAPMVSAMIAAMVTARGPDEDDDEGWAEFATTEWFLFLGATTPVIRDIARLIATGQGSSGTMVSSVGESLTEAPSAVVGLFLDDDMSGEKKFSNIIKAVSGFVPLPGSGNITRILDYVDASGQWPDSAGEYYEGFVQGKKAAN